MREVTEEALILRAGRFRERDVWVRYLSPARGLVTAFAFGGAVSRRRFAGCLEPLSIVRFRVAASRTGSYQQLAEGELLEAHAALRTDLPRLGMAVNCLKFAEALQPGPEGAAAAFVQLRAALARLCRQPPVADIWPLLVRARLTFLAGYAPDLAACGLCAAPVGGGAFSVEKGRLICDTCRAGNRREALLPAGTETVALLAAVLAGGPDTWDHLSAGPRTRRECFDIVEAFVEFHLGLSQQGAGFRRI